MWILVLALLLGSGVAARDDDREVIGNVHVDGEPLEQVDVATSPTSLTPVVRGKPTHDKSRLKAAMTANAALAAHTGGPSQTLPWERPRHTTAAADTTPSVGRAPPTSLTLSRSI